MESGRVVVHRYKLIQLGADFLDDAGEVLFPEGGGLDALGITTGAFAFDLFELGESVALEIDQALAWRDIAVGENGLVVATLTGEVIPRAQTCEGEDGKLGHGGDGPGLTQENVGGASVIAVGLGGLDGTQAGLSTESGRDSG